MTIATSRISMTEITDICGHGAENGVTHGPFQSGIRLVQLFIVIQDSKTQGLRQNRWVKKLAWPRLRSACPRPQLADGDSSCELPSPLYRCTRRHDQDRDGTG